MFKNTLLVASLILAILPSAACVEDSGRGQATYPGTINSQSAPIFDDAQSCDAETPCPSGLECMYVAALEVDTPICVDAATICEAINCGDGNCLFLESYPGQLVCQSGDDGDGSGGNDCSIDSDGNTSCPDDCVVSSDGTTTCPDDSGEGSEPGSPGENS